MFGTSGVRGAVGETITADLALDIGRALTTDGAKRVVIGRDARESGWMLARAFTAGITECGGDVIDVGVAPTPTVARTVRQTDADAGAVITASHNPASDNGLKLWTATGQAFDADANARIAQRVRQEQFTFAAHDEIGTVRHDETAQSNHMDALTAAVSLPSDLTVVVDLGNGVGRITADTLAAAGCAVETLNAQRDGTFPGRPSEPTAANCETACTLVAETNADLGLVHDGDADRLMAIDEQGQFVSGDALLAVFARHAAEPGDTVAVPINTSQLVADVLAESGVDVTYTRVGDAAVAARTDDPNVVFGGEPSGAWIWPAETRCPDGPLAACRLTALVDELGSLARVVAELPTYATRRDAVETDAKGVLADRIETLANEQFEQVTTLDGVRVETETGWFLIRASGTQPLIRVTAEARAAADADTLLNTARDLVEQARSACESDSPA